MTDLEKKQIEYLEKRKEHLIWQMMGACDDINQQIKSVKNGEWLQSVKGKEIK